MNYTSDFENGRFDTSLGTLFYLHHRGNGSAPTLVFLHGVGTSHMVWKKLMEITSGEYGVYLLDELGHGESDAPRIDYTIKNQATALREFVTGNGIENYYLVGHSYGAWISAYYASVYDDLAGMVLEDSAGIKEEFDDILESGMVEEYRDGMLKQLLSMNNNKDYVMNSILDSDLTVKYQLGAEVLSRIKTRTLIVWGRNDKTVDIKYAAYLSNGIKESSFKVIEGAGHTPHYTHAKEFYSLIDEFVNEKS